MGIQPNSIASIPTDEFEIELDLEVTQNEAVAVFATLNRRDSKFKRSYYGGERNEKIQFENQNLPVSNNGKQNFHSKYKNLFCFSNT